MKPYYEDDAVRLFHGDFADVLPGLAGQHFDAIVTDPPYAQTSLDWDVWPVGWPTELLALSDQLWCFGSMKMFLDRRDEFAGWRFAQEIVWEKHNGSGFASDRFKRVHEFATHWYQGEWGSLYNETPTTQDAVRKTARRKERPPHTGDIENSAYSSEDGGSRIMRSVVRLRSMHGKAVNETQKPVPLVSLAIENSVPPGGVVLDIFAGSGTTGVAARRLGRRAVLIEKRESQCEKAVKRLRAETDMPLDIFGAIA